MWTIAQELKPWNENANKIPIMMTEEKGVFSETQMNVCEFHTFVFVSCEFVLI